jgi:hypothetical protein
MADAVVPQPRLKRIRSSLVRRRLPQTNPDATRTLAFPRRLLLALSGHDDDAQ